MRGDCDRRRRVLDHHDPRQARRQSAHAGDRRRDPGGRQGLPQSPIHDDRHRRRDPVRDHLVGARRAHRGRVPDRRGAFGARGLHRHERVGALERAHRRGGTYGAQRSACGRVPRRRDHRHAGGGAGPARRGGFLLVPGRLRTLGAESGQGEPAPHHRAAGRPRLRRIAHLDLRASGRRHLHQGRGRRRGPGRQGRSGHPGGRSAQSRGDRGQRRRQRRRLRRHGRGSVRNVRRDDRRHDAPGRIAAADGGGTRRAVSAGARWLLDPGVDRRLLLREGVTRRQDHERAVQGPRGGRRPVGDRLLVHHRPHDRFLRHGGPDPHHDAPVRRFAGRTRADRAHGRYHRVLHRHRLQAGQARRASIDHGARDQHHRRHRRVDEVHGVAGPRRLRCDLRLLPVRGPVRDRDRGDRHAFDGRHHRRARRLRPDHRQRRRHRRDGGPAGFGARDHRSARRRGQYDQGGDEGLCDRIGGSGRAGAVRGLHARARDREHRHHVRPVESHGDHRPLHRRPRPVSLRRDGDGGGRPRRRRGGGGSAPPVQGDQGHHGRHRQAGIRRGGRHADQGGDQGNDRAVAACRCWYRSWSAWRSGRRRWAAC